MRSQVHEFIRALRFTQSGNPLLCKSNPGFRYWTIHSMGVFSCWLAFCGATTVVETTAAEAIERIPFFRTTRESIGNRPSKRLGFQIGPLVLSTNAFLRPSPRTYSQDPISNVQHPFPHPFCSSIVIATNDYTSLRVITFFGTTMNLYRLRYPLS